MNQAQPARKGPETNGLDEFKLIGLPIVSPLPKAV
jgi:hypothetical protein